MNIYKRKIKKLMDERGMSQKTLAKKMGVSQSYVSQILSDKKYRGMRRSTLLKLAKVFHVPVDVFLTDEEVVVSLAKRDSQRIPILSWISLNTVTLSTYEHIALKAQEFISYDCEGLCFAVRVPQEGNATVIVQVGSEIKNGDTVLVEVEGEVKLGKINFYENFVILSNGELQVIKGSYRVIGKIVGKIFKYI